MEVFWHKSGARQRLILRLDDGHEEEVGGVRETKRGFDAFAKTFGYDPGRAQKGMPTVEEARAFVESFSPWELYGGAGSLTVDQAIRADQD